MAHTYTSQLLHCVFSTKERQSLITPELQERLWPYLGGIARENRMKALAIGGIADHVHLLVSLPSALSISKAMQLVKGGSSKLSSSVFSKSMGSNMMNVISGINVIGDFQPSLWDFADSPIGSQR